MQQPQPEEFFLKLPNPHVATIQAALKKMPWEIAHPVLVELDKQIIPQLQGQPAPAAEEPTE